ncbi:MAG: glycosyl hydrolase family 28-related protein [Rhodovibrionaceae bacterium]
MTDPRRRAILTGAAGAALMTGSTAFAGAAPAAAGDQKDYGLVGDGEADDSAALQRAFDAAFAGKQARLIQLPPGRYRVTRPIRVRTAKRPDGNVTHPAGLLANGVTLLSDIDSGEAVVDVDVRATLRFFRIEGLHIAGRGDEGAGLRISCQHRGAYFYNFCIRDCVVEGCGGNGCELLGNVFEGQVFNCYFRDNGHDGALLAHGAEDTVLSAVHLFGCVFGGNHRNGASLEEDATDVSFHGCYFLLNGRFGLSAEMGITLLSHCGFENNHQRAGSFAEGDAGVRLMVAGTLVGCTAYSIYKQKYLLRGYITNQLTMLGCKGAGDGDADAAGLASLKGEKSAKYSLIGCWGKVERDRNVEMLGVSPKDGGGSFGESWDSDNLLRLGDYRLWVDGEGQLRVLRGKPESDRDGQVVGS